jgi:hypothetical protein
MTAIMRVLIWLVEGTWQGCVDAARPLLPDDAEITLLHVTPEEVAEAAAGALAGLLGRGRPHPGRHPAERINALSGEAAAKMLAEAAARLGRQARQDARSGRVERVVVELASGATCWSRRATATARGSAQGALAPPPASSSTTLPAQSCWSGRTRRPEWNPSRPRRDTAGLRRRTRLLTARADQARFRVRP